MNKDIYEKDANKRGLTTEVQDSARIQHPPIVGRPVNPPHGTRFVDPKGYVVEWDGKHWRQPASGRIG